MPNIKNPKTEGFEDAFELFDTPDKEEDDNEIGSRWVEVHGKEFKFQFRDPYGHCYIIPRKGTLPSELTGAYTSVQEAERGLLQHYSRIEAAVEKARIHNTTLKELERVAPELAEIKKAAKLKKEKLEVTA